MASNTQFMPLERTVLGYINTKKNNANDDDDVNTIISIAPKYDANVFNDNGYNQNVLDLTGNTQIIEDNHIGQNIRNKYVRTLTNIMVLMVDNMPEKLVYREAPEGTNARDMDILSETNRKQRKFLKDYCKLLLKNEFCCKKKSYQIGGCWLFDV